MLTVALQCHRTAWRPPATPTYLQQPHPELLFRALRQQRDMDGSIASAELRFETQSCVADNEQTRLEPFDNFSSLRGPTVNYLGAGQDICCANLQWFALIAYEVVVYPATK